MAANKVYTFHQDMSSLRNNVDLLEKDYTPASTRRCCERIKAILDRILENREDSYVSREVRDYFREEE